MVIFQSKEMGEIIEYGGKQVKAKSIDGIIKLNIVNCPGCEKTCMVVDKTSHCSSCNNTATN